MDYVVKFVLLKVPVRCKVMEPASECIHYRREKQEYINYSSLEKLLVEIWLK